MKFYKLVVTIVIFFLTKMPWEDVHSAQIISTFIPKYYDPWGMTWDGFSLWVVSIGTIYRHNPETGEVIQKIPTKLPDLAIKGLGWDGQFLWVPGVGQTKLHKIDPVTGKVVATVQLKDPSGTIEGLAYDIIWKEGELWVLLIDPRSSLVKVDPNTGKISEKIYLEKRSTYGITWDGSTFWISSGKTGLISQIDPHNGKTLRTFPAPGGFPTGLVWDGHYLWIADTYGQGQGQRIYKVDVNAEPYEILISLHSFPTPLKHGKDLDWDNGLFWHTDSWDDIIFLLDPVNSSNVVKQISVPYYGPTGIVFDGVNLWNADGQSNSLFKLDADSGDILAQYRFPGITPVGLDFDGQDLWAVGWDDDKVYRLSRADGRQLKSFDAPASGTGGIVWDGEALWISDWLTDFLYKLDTATGEILQQFLIPTGSPIGITYDFDRKNFWVVDDEQDRIYELALPDGQYHILNFESTVLDSTVFVNWTITEGNRAEYFLVERKEFGQDEYQLIGSVAGSNDSFSFVDKNLEAGKIYYYRIQMVNSVGTGKKVGPLSVDFYFKYPFPEPDPTSPSVSYDLMLYQNFPNPFNNYTTIQYFVGRHSNVEVRIYDLLGRLVKMIQRFNQSVGTHSIKWDGTDKAGNRMSSGLYLVRIENEFGRSQTKRMLYIK